MAAYIIVDLVIHDPAAYAEYAKLTRATLQPYGGTFIVRGGPVEVLEGNWHPQRLVVLEFASADQARAWWSSPEYTEPKRMRQAAATTQMILVEGFVPT